MEDDAHMGKRTFLPVKSDIVFRLFYADERNQEFLISLLKSILKLPEDDYHEIVIADPRLLREFKGDKEPIIDVKLYTKTRKVIHIEIQLEVNPVMEKRIILYESKLITEQIGSGDDYDLIKKVISIIITDEDLIPVSPRYHHRFTFYDSEAGVEFSDIIEIHTLELRKLPEGTDGTELYDWAKFIAAETEEELTMLAERNPQIGKAVVKLRELSADERARDLYERREKARRDIAAEKKWAVKQTTFEIARNLLGLNMPVDQIVTATGLTREEVENQRTAL
jgi:predicted transposase/invertase (TIGR01784 family)